jgi:hypothetical protein
MQMVVEDEIDRVELAQANGKPVDPKRLYELSKSVKVLSSPDPGRPKGPAMPSIRPSSRMPALDHPESPTLAEMAARYQEGGDGDARSAEPSSDPRDRPTNEAEEPAPTDPQANETRASKARKALESLRLADRHTPSLADTDQPGNGNRPQEVP